MRTAPSIVLGLGLLVVPAPALAHHSFTAEYDVNKPITVTGTIARVDWVSPHSRLYVNATEPDGSVVTWAVELGDPNALLRQGWQTVDLKVGAAVTVEGYLARDGSRIAGSDVRLSAGSTGRFRPVPTELPAVLARVNGEVVERWELVAAIRDFDAENGHRLPAELRNEVVRSLLDDIIADHLLAQEARARTLEVTEADVFASIDRIRKRFRDEEAFVKALAAASMSVEQLQQRTRRSLQVSNLLDAEMGRVAGAQRDEKTDAFIRQLRARATIEVYV